MAERGLSVAHTAIMRWVQRYAPEFEKRWAQFRGEWSYLYRAADRAGRDGRLQAERDARYRGRNGILSQSDQKPAARSADDHPGCLCRLSSRGARGRHVENLGLRTE